MGRSAKSSPCSCPAPSVGVVVAGGVVAGGAAGRSMPTPSPAVTPRMPPPIIPPRTPAFMYSLIASSSSSGRPACLRSMICWAISVGISAAAPSPTPTAVRVSHFWPGFRNPPSRSLSPMALSADCPTALMIASETSTSALRPAATSASCRCTLPPKKDGKAVAEPAASPPRGPPATVPATVAARGASISGPLWPIPSPA